MQHSQWTSLPGSRSIRSRSQVASTVRQLAVTVEFEARTRQAYRRMVLIQGEAVLERLDPPLAGGLLEYDPNDQAYHVTWSQPGRHRVVATFAVQGVADPNGPWRQASLQVPDGRVPQDPSGQQSARS